MFRNPRKYRKFSSFPSLQMCPFRQSSAFTHPGLSVALLFLFLPQSGSIFRFSSVCAAVRGIPGFPGTPHTGQFTGFTNSHATALYSRSRSTISESRLYSSCIYHLVTQHALWLYHQAGIPACSRRDFRFLASLSVHRARLLSLSARCSPLPSYI